MSVFYLILPRKIYLLLIHPRLWHCVFECHFHQGVCTVLGDIFQIPDALCSVFQILRHILTGAWRARKQRTSTIIMTRCWSLLVSLKRKFTMNGRVVWMRRAHLILTKRSSHVTRIPSLLRLTSITR